MPVHCEFAGGAIIPSIQPIVLDSIALNVVFLCGSFRDLVLNSSFFFSIILHFVREIKLRVSLGTVFESNRVTGPRVENCIFV